MKIKDFHIPLVRDGTLSHATKYDGKGEESGAKLASAVLNQARAWIGCKEADGSHKQIIDTYNAHKPLARGYAVKYTDAWCATFVSAVAIKCGLTDIIPTECGCGQMIQLFQALGKWNESDSRTPTPGVMAFRSTTPKPRHPQRHQNQLIK